MNTVVEKMERFNHLQKAIKGLVVRNAELEALANSLLIGKVGGTLVPLSLARHYFNPQLLTPSHLYFCLTIQGIYHITSLVIRLQVMVCDPDCLPLTQVPDYWAKRSYMYLSLKPHGPSVCWISGFHYTQVGQSLILDVWGMEFH